MIKLKTKTKMRVNLVLKSVNFRYSEGEIQTDYIVLLILLSLLFLVFWASKFPLDTPLDAKKSKYF